MRDLSNSAEDIGSDKIGRRFYSANRNSCLDRPLRYDGVISEVQTEEQIVPVSKEDSAYGVAVMEKSQTEFGGNLDDTFMGALAPENEIAHIEMQRKMGANFHVSQSEVLAHMCMRIKKRDIKYTS